MSNHVPTPHLPSPSQPSPTHPSGGDVPSVFLVGAGPRTLGVLARLGSRVAAGEVPGLHVHVADPHDHGAGRVWRSGLDPLLWMNSRAADITVLPDPGPSLHRWIQANRLDLVHEAAAAGDDGFREEVLAVHEGSFVSRRLANRYLVWAWDHVLAELPPTVRVERHHRRVVDVRDDPSSPDGRQLVHVESDPADSAPGRDPVRVDTVLLQQGHLDTRPDARERRLSENARAHGLTYVRAGYTSDLDLTGLRAGEDVVVLGMGLAFVDLVVLLCEGRGGRFEPGEGDDLVYHPSGREPVLHAGSRRGVPYRSKITYALGSPPPLPRHYSPEVVAGLAVPPGGLDLRADLWPLIVKELAGAHYHELLTSHPDRTTMDREEFERRFAATAWGSSAADELVEQAVPDVADRFDLQAFDRPLDGFWTTGQEPLTDHVTAHVDADRRRHGDPAHSPDAAVVSAVLSAYVVTRRLHAQGLLSARSVAVDLDGWWHGFFSYVASGPPPERVRQLSALARAGVLRFLGADTRVDLDTAAGTFRARSASSPAVVHARALVEARLPQPNVAVTADPLLRALHERGEVSEQRLRPAGTAGDPGPRDLSTGRIVVDGAGRLVDAHGAVHPRRFAAGAWVAGGGSPGAFARPGGPSPVFSEHDELAGWLLDAARSPHLSPTPAGRRAHE